jgi:Transposase, Mutator family
MKEWMGAELSALDIMVVQIDGIHISEHLVLVAALGIDSQGFKHPLGLMEGSTEHSAVVQALIDDLIERGLDPAVPRLFIIDGSKALAKAIRRSFGRHTPIQRCQIHKARNIMERLSPALHASVRRVLRQAWELDDAAKAEKLIRNLAQRLERDAPGVSKSILEGLDEILTVSRLGLPAELRRSLACTNIIENATETFRSAKHGQPKHVARRVHVTPLLSQHAHSVGPQPNRSRQGPAGMLESAPAPPARPGRGPSAPRLAAGGCPAAPPPRAATPLRCRGVPTMARRLLRLAHAIGTRPDRRTRPRGQRRTPSRCTNRNSGAALPTLRLLNR